MHLQSSILILTSLVAATSAGICWTSPLGILLGKPPRQSIFGPPARAGDCNLPIGGGGTGNIVRPPPPPPPVTVTACTATVTACTATACTATETACTATETAYQMDPASIAAGVAACAGRYGAARPTPLFNGAGRPKCCAPIYEKSPAGVVLAQCLG